MHFRVSIQPQIIIEKDKNSAGLIQSSGRSFSSETVDYNLGCTLVSIVEAPIKTVGEDEIDYQTHFCKWSNLQRNTFPVSDSPQCVVIWVHTSTIDISCAR